MRLHTAQMAKWRKIDKSITVLDITVKSGEKFLAPSWDILSEYRNSGDEARYRARFRLKMLASLKNEPERWEALCSHDDLAIMCYCNAGKFCHRHIIAEIIKLLCIRNNIPFTLEGEIT